MNSTPLKFCPRCEEHKSMSDFARSKANKSGVYGYCKTCHAAYQRVHIKAKPQRQERANEASLRWYHKNKPRWRERRNRYNARLREATLVAYGHACQCCGVTASPFLALDHIAGDGGGRGRPWSDVGSGLYQRLKREGYPAGGLRLLCHSCHSSISWYGYCPHQHRPPAPSDKQKRLRRRRKLAVIERLGGRCVCCRNDTWEFLTIDHVYGDGAAERRATGLTSVAFHDFLLSDSCDITRYRLLCASCHFARAFYGHCPHESGV
jgi:hypothetical protein